MKKVIYGILALTIFVIVLISGCIEEKITTCETDDDCALSLCDCNCHIRGQTPEELEGKICGINCRGEYGVLGCECSIQPDTGKGICVKVMESVSVCAEDGEIFSRVSDEYPDSCCEGLKEWGPPIPDTRFSIADMCYEVGPPVESNIGMCIECGDGLCEHHLMYDENPCNCPEDCAGKGKSMFSSIEEFCLSNDWNLSISEACEDAFKGFPICELCL